MELRGESYTGRNPLDIFPSGRVIPIVKDADEHEDGSDQENKATNQMKPRILTNSKCKM